MARANWSERSARKNNSGTHTDNADPEGKLLVRRAAIASAAPGPRVLDCFAGEGHMFEGVWKGAAREYLGMDQRFFRPKGDPAGECWRGNNAILIRRAMKLGPWDIVDLDSYANPWPLLRLILNAAPNDRIVVTATCGIDRAIRAGSSDFGAAIAGASGLSYLGLLTRWYDDVIRWALAWATEQNGFRVSRARRVRSAKNSQIRYWCIELERPKAPIILH